MYEQGKGVPQDYKEAAKWYRKSAEQGDADAQDKLGLMYYNGQGVPKDYKEAVKWYTKAAEQGDDGLQQPWDYVRQWRRCSGGRQGSGQVVHKAAEQEMLLLSTISGVNTGTEKAFPKIIRKRLNGSESLPNRGIKCSAQP